ncbi:MAG: hypothetical protein MI863_08140 [Desulfobacterales bacterium]|nr:hypothetical protein [Desulfobacterales bacterium]
MDLLIDRYLPVYDFNEIHQIRINNTPDRVYPLLIPLDMNRSKIIKSLFFLRGLPAKDIRLDRMLSAGPFELLEENPGKEIAIGLLTDDLLKDLTVPARDFFPDYRPEKGLKIAWNFHIDNRPQNTVHLSTETRIQCFGDATRLFFSWYWFFIRPFSGIIRMEMLKIVRHKAEQSG